MSTNGSNSHWDVEIYTDSRGYSPLRGWLSRLDYSIKSRIFERFNRLSCGNFGDHKALSGGVYELRFRFGAGYRIYYGLIDNRIILLLCGGDKSSQSKDIKKALDYWKDYKENLP